MPITVVANGETVSVTDGATVADLLQQLGLSERVMVVERNGAPVPRSARVSTVLGEGDRLELVRAAAGG